MAPLEYYDQVRFGDDLRSLRYQMVRYAVRYGIKPAARVFHTTPRTVRKWIKRWAGISPDLLIDGRSLRVERKSRISETDRKTVIGLKMKHKCWGAVKIKKRYNLKISDKAIRKIWKTAGLTPKRN